MSKKKKFDLESARNKLSGSRFRNLNETLYTLNSEESFKLFNQNPQLFITYHEGFNKQASSWPCNPLDFIIKKLTSHDPSLIIGDMGCGEAKIAKIFTNRKVHSFDLVAMNSRVIACNMANLPLEDSSLDIAIFCLSLMGKDWPLFILETSRCLKIGGYLYIVEVMSRLKNKGKFIKFICKFGYKLKEVKNLGKGFFIYLQFNRISITNIDVKESDLLLPCLYKKR